MKQGVINPAMQPHGFSPLAKVCLALLMVSLASTALAQPFDYRLSPREIAPDVFLLEGLTEDFSRENGGNIVNTGFIVGAEGVIVIDTGPSRRYGEQMLAAIRRITDRPIVLTINTHHHPDHFLGNQAFPANTLAALPGTIVGIREEGEGFNENMYRLNGDWMRGTEVVLPTVTLASGRRPVAGRDIELLGLSGHTAADLVLIDHVTGTVFASDLLFMDRAATTPHADLGVWLQSLDTLEALPAARWVPGHGPVVSDLSALQQTRSYLSWLRDTIDQGANEGMDMAEMLSQAIPERFQHLAQVHEEYRRSVIHLFPAAELAALKRSRN